MKPGLGHAAVIFRSTDICHVDLLCRTAVYVTRMYGGVGGGAVRLLPIPIRRRGRHEDGVDRAQRRVVGQAL